MEDRITKSMVEEFLKSENRSFSDESKSFEHFSNYCVLNQIYGANDFELEDIETGDSTPGMDGIAIIVNNKLIQTTNDIDTLIQQNQNIAVKFIIIQTKTSEKFNNREMTNLFTYANCFFTGDPTVFNTEEMHKFLELKDYIFDKGNKLKKNPELFLFYVTLGMWNSSDKNLVTAQDLGTKNLKASRLFSDVKFIPIGVSEIQDYYRKSKSKLTATFNFEKRVSMYSLNENEVGYTGVLPFREFKKLLLEESGAVKPVFEDNIRDYLGPNEDVNKSIRRTLETGNVNAFSMLNNGITIVASHINTPGDFATIDDYQIVNGTVVKRVGNKIFKEDDELSIYYVSALALYKIENLFKNGTLNKKYRRSRYHAMMLFRMYVGKGKMPYFNEKKMKKNCDEILDVLMNNCECERLYRGIVEFIVSNGESIEIDNRKCFERKETTEFLTRKMDALREYLREYK
ncbi:MAG: AIPR family protein [Succinivibrionaceae bacterium]|nr:AIPR family protein [Succinivibrionaceae bacterium]